MPNDTFGACYGTSLHSNVRAGQNPERLRQTIRTEFERTLREIAPDLEPGIILDVLVDVQADAIQASVRIVDAMGLGTHSTRLITTGNRPTLTDEDAPFAEPVYLNVARHFEEVDRFRRGWAQEYAADYMPADYMPADPPPRQQHDDRVDAFTSAYAVEADRAVGQDRTAVARVRAPMFLLHSNPTFSLNEIRNRRFSLHGDMGLPAIWVDRTPPTTNQILLAVLRKKLPRPYVPEALTG